jgi:hypothetical protein
MCPIPEHLRPEASSGVRHDLLMTPGTSARTEADQAFDQIGPPVMHKITHSYKMNGGVLTIMLSVKVNARGCGFIGELFATFVLHPQHLDW